MTLNFQASFLPSGDSQSKGGQGSHYLRGLSRGKRPPSSKDLPHLVVPLSLPPADFQRLTGMSADFGLQLLWKCKSDYPDLTSTFPEHSRAKYIKGARVVPKGLSIKSPDTKTLGCSREDQYWGILAIAGDMRLIFMKMYSSIYEAKVGASVEHVEIDGRASINDGRYCF